MVDELKFFSNAGETPISKEIFSKVKPEDCKDNDTISHVVATEIIPRMLTPENKVNEYNTDVYRKFDDGGDLQTVKKACPVCIEQVATGKTPMTTYSLLGFEVPVEIGSTNEEGNGAYFLRARGGFGYTGEKSTNNMNMKDLANSVLLVEPGAKINFDKLRKVYDKDIEGNPQRRKIHLVVTDPSVDVQQKQEMARQVIEELNKSDIVDPKLTDEDVQVLESKHLLDSDSAAPE